MSFREIYTTVWQTQTKEILNNHQNIKSFLLKTKKNKHWYIQQTLTVLILASWSAIVQALQMVKSSKIIKKSGVKKCVCLCVSILQGIICTVRTQADDSSISANYLEQSIARLPFWWVQLWEISEMNERTQHSKTFCNKIIKWTERSSFDKQVPWQAAELRMLMQSSLMWRSSSMSRRCWSL